MVSKPIDLAVVIVVDLLQCLLLQSGWQRKFSAIGGGWVQLEPKSVGTTFPWC